MAENANISSPVDKVFPSSASVPAAIPASAENYLQQAINTVREAPDASVMVSGSAVDAMLVEKGYEDGSVSSRINKAVDDGILVKDMGKWAHLVRLESNNPRHVDTAKPHVSESEAQRSLNFALALGTYWFELPSLIQTGLNPNNDNSEDQS